jgi:RimJ/RimL family protein N-acetyltransferase
MDYSLPMRIDPSIILEGQRVRLEPLRLDHAAALFEQGHDEEIWRYMPIDMPDDVEAMRRWIGEALAQAAAGTAVPFAIVQRRDARIIGSTRFHEIVPEHHVVEIGWSWLGRAYWRTGINVECKYLLLRQAFEQWGAIRVQLKTDVRNVRSQTAIAGLGAQREGEFRNHRIIKGGYRRTSVYFSIIEEEWPAVQADLERRLQGAE